MLIGSLFAGIGGLELGLERAGLGFVAWQVELDPWCREVLAKHWPDAQRHEDVRTVGAANLSPVDVICGGFPCQDVSAAGRGKGLEGERSGLWYEMLRIVRELGPRVVIVENVSALQRRGLDVVARGLRDAGYAVEATRIRAEDVGAPHRRERLFIVAYAGSKRLQGLIKGGTAARSTQRGDFAVAYADSDGCEGITSARIHDHGQPRHDAFGRHGFPPRRGDEEAWRTWTEHGGPQPGVRRGADGVVSRLDGFARRNRLKALGNAVVPQVAEAIGRRVRERLGW